MNALVPTHTVEQVCAFRDEAIRHYELAFEKIEEAAKAVAQASALWEAAAPGKPGDWSDSREEISHFHNAVNLPDRDRYLRTARRLIDVTVWTHVIDMAGIEQLMDAQAKKELRSQMKYVPERRGRDGEIINQDEIDRMLPPVTPENIYATLDRFQGDAEMIFRRGIVNVFTKLDRRFRSHDGFKVGSRMILDYIVDRDGWFRSFGGKVDLLYDVERTFLVLDGKPAKAKYASIVAKIDRERTSRFTPHQSEHEGDYFRIRIFKNGNAHLWFTRKDLVEKINKILAEHYGEVIGDGMTKEEDPLKNVKTTPARYFGFYPTPDSAADNLISKISLLRKKEEPQLRILEPSAGTGNLARRCITTPAAFDNWSGGRDRYMNEYRFDNLVDCIEVQPHLAHELQAAGIYGRVTCADFLKVQPDPARLYDRIVMNPPFDRERDIDHVVHALDFLKPDGCLVAIMSAGTEFRETKKSIAFRELMAKMKAEWQDLPTGSFAEVGTYVNTLMIRVWKDGRKQNSMRW
ncbi:putative N6 adenine-specific DNA methyltransferase, N12 class [Pseudorhizobium banfieldiae]|uniref:Putative N6 adenine-specific DNA methyltransferase, N12 class n=1 Tax=Pseudorhizobium banfieldiae TaxID=1125847 RepID=L0NDH1_9HYPH|nr:DUF4942 domain-containing protein [Pseudorhizobium banfieldiae]CAD6606039.1 hypothetical protein RNT25_01769 [arsenite-oxidising bacterium NT-25]CCF19115.1 putative N6 adenine-specific DNA methyltransferase, N12 class [Pseudorhizobium banfieldiae]